MPNDAQPAESSPAAVTPAPPFDLETLSPEERTDWKLTGSLPTTDTDRSSPADSTPAEPAAQVASTEASSQTVSETVTPDKPKTAERFQELLAERARERELRQQAERELAALRAAQAKPDASAVPSPAPGSEFPAFDAWQDAHPDGQYDEFLLEKFEHVQAGKQTAAQQQAAQAHQHLQREARQQAFRERYQDALKASPAASAALDPSVLALRPVDRLGPDEPVTALNLVAQEIMESEQPLALLSHLSAHPDVLDALSTLTSPTAVVRQMARLEAQLATPAISPVKTISTAPPLTPTLGSRATTPGDPITSAVKNGDFQSYREAANAREMATK